MRNCKIKLLSKRSQTKNNSTDAKFQNRKTKWHYLWIHLASKTHYKAKGRTDYHTSLDSGSSGEKMGAVLWRDLWDPGAEGSVHSRPTPDHQQQWNNKQEVYWSLHLLKETGVGSLIWVRNWTFSSPKWRHEVPWPGINCPEPQASLRAQRSQSREGDSLLDSSSPTLCV